MTWSTFARVCLEFAFAEDVLAAPTSGPNNAAIEKGRKGNACKELRLQHKNNRNEVIVDRYNIFFIANDFQILSLVLIFRGNP